MKARILVIDDDAVACEFLQEVLQRDGYDVGTFTCAQTALKQNLAEYDLLMSDIRMPGMDGLQFLGEIQKNGRTCPSFDDGVRVPGNHHGGDPAGRVGLYQQTLFTGRMPRPC